MKNWTNDGKMHYDASTAEQPRAVKFTFISERKRMIDVVVLVPHTIKTSLNSADFDFVRKQLPEWHKEHVVQAVNCGVFDLDLIDAKIGPILAARACATLYTEFIMKQSKAGNEVWQAPPTMTEIGPSPDEDERYNDGTGRLVM